MADAALRATSTATPDATGSQGNENDGADTKKFTKRTWKTKFDGRCEDLKGHVYDNNDGRVAADVYTRTTKEIADYVGQKYRQGGDIRSTIQNMRRRTFTRPPHPGPGADPADLQE